MNDARTRDRVAIGCRAMIILRIELAQTMVDTFSAKKGIAPSKQDTWLSKWGPSMLVFVFFIGKRAPYSSRAHGRHGST